MYSIAHTSLVHHVICLFLHVFLLVLPLVVVPVLERRAFKQLLLGSLLGLEVLVRVSLNSDLVLNYAYLTSRLSKFGNCLRIGFRVSSSLSMSLKHWKTN